MLHYEAHYSDANPSAEAHQNGFATSFNQLHDIGVKADGAHGQHNEEFTQGLQRIKGFDSYTHVQSYSGDNGSQHKVDDEEKVSTKSDGSLAALPLIFKFFVIYIVNNDIQTEIWIILPDMPICMLSNKTSLLYKYIFLRTR